MGSHVFDKVDEISESKEEDVIVDHGSEEKQQTEDGPISNQNPSILENKSANIAAKTSIHNETNDSHRLNEDPCSQHCIDNSQQGEKDYEKDNLKSEVSTPLGLTFSQYKRRGSDFKTRSNYCIVSDVKPNSPASGIGFQVADLICYDTSNSTPLPNVEIEENEAAVAASYEEVTYWFTQRKRPFDIVVKRGDLQARRIIQECVMSEIINNEILHKGKQSPYCHIESEDAVKHPLPFQSIVYVISKTVAPFSGGYAYVADYHSSDRSYDVQYIYGREEKNIPCSWIRQVSLDALPPIGKN